MNRFLLTGFSWFWAPRARTIFSSCSPFLYKSKRANSIKRRVRALSQKIAKYQEMQIPTFLCNIFHQFSQPVQNRERTRRKSTFSHSDEEKIDRHLIFFPGKRFRTLRAQKHPCFADWGHPALKKWINRPLLTRTFEMDPAHMGSSAFK